MKVKIIYFLFLATIFTGCKLKNKNLLLDFKPLTLNGNINVVIEIPTGTNEKWEVNKQSGLLELEILKGNIPRVIDYIPYPANYGMIPRTLLPKELGGDGDPLDVIVLGKPISGGSVVECKLIGVLKLLDRGEQDDKLIAVSLNSIFNNINSLEELDLEYKGVSEVLKIWFSNYKGEGLMEFKGC